MTNITQEDRDAAARWYAQEYHVEMDCLVCQSILSGEEDCQDRVAVFARHREAAEARERERIVAWMKERERESLNGHVIAGCRMGIERGEHMEANNATSK